jgi:hypothetical protein
MAFAIMLPLVEMWTERVSGPAQAKIWRTSAMPWGKAINAVELEILAV